MIDKKVVIQNLERAIHIVKNYPTRLLDLENFKLTSTCGTLMCTAGLLATKPSFQKQGMRFDPHDGVVVVDSEGEAKTLFTSGTPIFGPDAFDRLFAQRNLGGWDRELVDPPMTDKDLALARLRKQLQVIKDEG